MAVNRIGQGIECMIGCVVKRVHYSEECTHDVTVANRDDGRPAMVTLLSVERITGMTADDHATLAFLFNTLKKAPKIRDAAYAAGLMDDNLRAAFNAAERRVAAEIVDRLS